MTTIERFGDCCLQTSISTGSGPFTLGATVGGHQAIIDAYATGKCFSAKIEGVDALGALTAQWVTVKAHLTSSTVLVVDTVYDGSSGDGVAVVFAGAAYLRIFVSPTREGLEEWLEFKTSGVSTLTYAATVDIDFSGTPNQELDLTGDVTFTFSNLAAGRNVSVWLNGDGSDRTVTLPAGVKSLGTGITQVTAGKVGFLSLVSRGTSDARVVAGYGEES